MRAPQGILETVIYAVDLVAAEGFYTKVIGLEVVSLVPGKFVFLRCDQQMLLIFNPEASRLPDKNTPIPRHGTTGAGHVCFRVETRQEVDAWRDHFTDHAIEIEHYHRWENDSYSVYVRDPAGNSVEVAEVKLWQAD